MPAAKAEPVNPHWDVLAEQQQWQRLQAELGMWRERFRLSLQDWLSQCGRAFEVAGAPLLEALGALEVEPVEPQWSVLRSRIEAIHQQASRLKNDFFTQCGPTELACLNSVLYWLESRPEQPGVLGSYLFDDLRALEQWAQTHSIHGEAYEALRSWLEELALSLLSGPPPSAEAARPRVIQLWNQLEESLARQRVNQELVGPTGSQRWNSLLWLLAEEGRCEPDVLLEALLALDSDLQELQAWSDGSLEVEEIVLEVSEHSQRLQQQLEQGRWPRGWFKVLEPLLVELEARAPRPDPSQPPPHAVRQICQRFEGGRLSIEQFQSELSLLSRAILQGREQSRVQQPQHPTEAGFLEALSKLQGGLEILESVERPGQASRLEMGCALVEEGLAQLQQLESEA